VVPAPNAEPSRRVVVVSPHFDDGVLSLGASIARWSRRGAVVELLTVLGCDPDSEAPSGGWDRRGGFATEGEAARARRAEDRRACAVLGAIPVWLPFGSVDYDRHGDEADVLRAVGEAVAGADLVLMPGFPLSHPDHEWLVRLLVATRLGGRVALYAEQPYTLRERRDPEAPAWLCESLHDGSPFRQRRARLGDRRAKWRAIRRYRSQLALLGMRGNLRGGPLRYALVGEWIGCLAD